MSDPVNAPPNTDDRPVDIVREQGDKKASRDPTSEAATTPPSMPPIPRALGLTPPQEDAFRDLAASVVYQVLKKVTVNGMPAQLSGDSMDFAVAGPSASEQFTKQNSVPYSPPPPPLLTRPPEETTNSNSTPVRDTSPTANPTSTPVRDTSPTANPNSTSVRDTSPTANPNSTPVGKPDRERAEDRKARREEAKAESRKKEGPPRDVADRANTSYLGKGHTRVLMTRGDNKVKIIATVDVAATAIVKNSEDDDDENDVLPAEDDYYVAGYSKEFYCWKAGVAGTIRILTGGKFHPLEE